MLLTLNNDLKAKKKPESTVRPCLFCTSKHEIILCNLQSCWGDYINLFKTFSHMAITKYYLVIN